MKRWKKLTDEQLRGAEYAMRVVRTSPRIRGLALEMVDMLLEELHKEMKKRNASTKV